MVAPRASAKMGMPRPFGHFWIHRGNPWRTVGIHQVGGQHAVTLWLFNIAMENDPFIEDFPIKTSIYKGFSMAMLNNQMVYGIYINGLV